MFRSRIPKSPARAGAAALLTAVAAVAITGLGTAEAMATTHSHSGDNGTVKIHRTTTPVNDPRNEPHVCGFYLDGFHFDTGQQVSWKILSWPPTGNRTEVLHGTLTLGQDGNGRTADLSLPNGHYKLYWNFNGEHGSAKQKVFWVKCDSTQPSPPGTPSPNPSPTSSTTTSPTSAPSASPSSTTTPPAPAPTPVPTDLPVTG
jgi:hypothetical protein